MRSRVLQADSDEDGSLSDSSGNEYEVECVLDRRVNSRTGAVEYLVQWAGDWGPDTRQWLPEDCLANAQDAVRAFHERTAGAAASASPTKTGKATKRLPRQQSQQVATAEPPPRRQVFIVSDEANSSDDAVAKQKSSSASKKRRHKKKRAEKAAEAVASAEANDDVEVEEGEISDDSSSSRRRKRSGRSRTGKHRKRRREERGVGDQVEAKAEAKASDLEAAAGPQPLETSAQPSVPKLQTSVQQKMKLQAPATQVPQPQAPQHLVPQPQASQHQVPQPQAPQPQVPQPQAPQPQAPQPQVAQPQIPQPQTPQPQQICSQTDDQVDDNDDDEEDDEGPFAELRIAESGDTPSEGDGDNDDNDNEEAATEDGGEGGEGGADNEAGEEDELADQADDGLDGIDAGEDAGSAAAGPSDPRRLQLGAAVAAGADGRTSLPTGAVIRKRQTKLLNFAGREIVHHAHCGRSEAAAGRSSGPGASAAAAAKPFRSAGDSDAWKATLASELANPARQVKGSPAEIMRSLLAERDAEFPPRLLTEKELLELVRDPERPLAALSQALRHPECPSLNEIPANRTNWLLHCAAKCGLTEALQLLLQFGADPDLPESRTGRTALMTAAGLGLQIACDLLLQARASLELRDHRGGTALLHAARLSQIATMRYLLCRGAEFAELWPGRASGIPEEAIKEARLWVLQLQSRLFSEIEQVVRSGLPGAQITCSLSPPFVVSPSAQLSRVLTFATPEDLKEGQAGRSLDCLFIAVAHFPGNGHVHPMLSGPDMVSSVQLNGVVQPSFTPPHQFMTACQPLRPPGEINELKLQLPAENAGMSQLRVLLQAYRLSLD